MHTLPSSNQTNSSLTGGQYLSSAREHYSD